MKRLLYSVLHKLRPQAQKERDQLAIVQNLFRKYASAVVPVEVANKYGDLSIGSAFHVGDNVYVTARHVLGKDESSRGNGCASWQCDLLGRLWSRRLGALCMGRCLYLPG